MKRVLVTGGRGFVGRHCLDRLLQAGFEVHALTSSTSERQASCVHWHHGDLLDRDKAGAIIQSTRPSHLLHLAWITTPGEYWTSPRNQNWQSASCRLFGAFLDQGGERIVAAGTCAEYDWSTGTCHESETPLVPASPYGRAKKIVYEHLESLRGAGADGAWARLFWMYGPHERPERLVPTVIRNLLSGRPAECSSGTHRRDYMHVADTAAALVRLLESDVQGAVNIGSGEAVRIADLVNEIGQLLDSSELIQLGRRPMGDEPPLVVADVRRLRNEVGFVPARPLSAGLRETIRWWRHAWEMQSHAS